MIFFLKSEFKKVARVTQRQSILLYLQTTGHILYISYVHLFYFQYSYSYKGVTFSAATVSNPHPKLLSLNKNP